MIPAKAYIKRLTTVPEQFVDELFEFYDSSTIQTDFVIVLEAVAKWLKTLKKPLVLTLKRSYRLDVDYIVQKGSSSTKKDQRHNNYKTYLLTPDCFKRLALMSKSKNAEMIRTYFIEIESLFIKYRDQTLEGMQADIARLERNQKPKGNFEPHTGYLYIIRTLDEKEGLYKIGRSSKNIIARLRNYNTGKADDIEVLYTYKANDVVGAEGCLKAYLKKYQYRKYKEVYQTDLKMIKEFMVSCAEVGAKLVQKSTKSSMKGGYFIVVDAQ
jgi:phage anti-repressor protein